jgi:hypothetical protein
LVDTTTATTGGVGALILPTGGIYCGDTLVCQNFICPNVITQKQYFFETVAITAQSIPNATATAVTYLAPAGNTGSANWNPGAASSFTAPVDGYYLISATVSWQAATGGTRYLAVANGTSLTTRYTQQSQFMPNSSSIVAQNASVMVFLPATTAFSVVVNQSSGSAININDGTVFQNATISAHFINN